jgi:hypothetical protein
VSDPIHAVDAAMSLMREALAILDDPENAAVAEQLKRAIKLAEGDPLPAKANGAIRHRGNGCARPPSTERKP